MRYMIERGLYLADILNRTLVIPTDLRIRSCSSPDETICTQTATYLTPGSANSRNDQGSVFALDMGYFFDLPHLAEKTGRKVIDFRTFMEEVVGVGTETLSRLRDTDFGAQALFALKDKKYPGGHLEDGIDGSDIEEEVEKERIDDKKKKRDIVLKAVERDSWDLAEDPKLSIINNIIRNGLVDTLDEEGDLQSPYGQVQEDGTVHVNRSFFAFADVQGGGVGRIVNWSVQFQYQPTTDKKDPIRRSKGRPLLNSCRPPLEEPSADQIPWESRFPGFATCHITNYVGLAQQLGQVDADVLVVEGQFHTTGWIPLAYSSLENARRHQRMALTYLRYSPAVHEAADYLMGKLKSRIQRRSGDGFSGGDSPEKGDYSWLRLSMHVRRGDFVSEKHGWQNYDDSWMSSLVKDAVESVFGPLDSSLNISNPTPALISVSEDTTGDVSHDSNNDSRPPPSQSSIKIPKFGFYMSTDETSPAVLDYFQSLGAILFEDLLDPTFESRFGHLIIFDDWIGLVEQLICARAEMFVGTMSSSFSSGILNLRLEDEGVDREGDSRKFAYLYRKGGPVLTPEQQQQQKDRPF
ncbi:hypothetical protein BGZ96_006478 [Linnemannia gamsii]|uniref:Uncharacterized protein n=1 Tax=Linnemannia gamsii TaxID=64522 RepID=A0ABQ7K3X5_9FUNG|nr:hypothetical protein BGZ96_006478 [Linnemannia gamsii]